MNMRTAKDDIATVCQGLGSADQFLDEDFFCESYEQHQNGDIVVNLLESDLRPLVPVENIRLACYLYYLQNKHQWIEKDMDVFTYSCIAQRAVFGGIIAWC